MADDPNSEWTTYLAAGAATVLALLFSRGRGRQEVKQVAENRFPLLDDKRREDLLSLAEAQSQAALALNSPANRYVADPALIPVNDQLFGGENEGRRQRNYYVGVTPEGDEWIRISIDFPDVISPEDARQQAIERMWEIYGMYPERFRGYTPESPDDIEIRTIDTSRAF